MMETSTSTQFSGQARKIKIHPDKISCTLINENCSHISGNGNP